MNKDCWDIDGVSRLKEKQGPLMFVACDAERIAILLSSLEIYNMKHKKN
jgi:hypothetical protein